MRRRKITVAQPNDLAFLLIIFFLLLVGVYGVRSINLSTVSQAVVQTDSPPVVLTLNASGILRHEGIVLSTEDFHQLLQTIKTTTLRIAGETEWQKVITVLSKLDERGITVALERLP